VVIGETGRNFAAGMSGGIAYVWDPKGDFKTRCNLEMVGLEELQPEDLETVKQLLKNHQQATGSTVAQKLLDLGEPMRKQFVKVMPTDYKKALELMKQQAAQPVA